MTRRRTGRTRAISGEVMAGGARTVKYGAAHLRPYVSPWATWLILPLLGSLFHAIASASTPAGVAVGAVAGGSALGLIAFTWHVFAPRAHSIRVHATVTIAAAAAWVLWVTGAGVFQYSPWQGWDILDWLAGWFVPWPWGAWLLLGPVGALTWNLRRISRGDGQDTHRDSGGDLLEKVGLAGRVKRVELEAGGNRVRAGIQVERGTHTAADVQGVKGSIASALGVRRTAVRVIEDPDDFSRAEVLVTPRDLLAEKLTWPGPTAPGASIVEELHAGRYEDGDTARLWLPGDPSVQRNAVHLAVSGMSGAGKTESGLCVVTDALTRSDVSFLFSDPVKGIQSVGPIAAGIGLLATEQAQAVAAFRRLPDVIRARTAYLGKHGHKQWVPGCGLKYLVAWFEEAAALLADSETFVKVTEQARSAGISLVISQQRLTHDRMPTSARANLGGGWCFGVNKDDEAKFSLSDETLDAGASPWEWKNGKPGYSYLEAPGVDPERWSIPLRGFLGDEAHLTEVVDEHVQDPALDPVTAEAFGKVYADYRRQVDEGATAWQTAPTRKLVAVPSRMPELGDDEDLDVDGDQDEDDVDFDYPEQPEPGFMDDIDPTQDIPDEDEGGIPLVPAAPTRAMSTTEARAALRKLLDRMAAEGHETVQPCQLVEFRQRVGRQASWLTKELRRLVDEGTLSDEPERGVYGLPARDLVAV